MADTADTADNPLTRPLEDVARGFGQLASWYWGLVTDQASHPSTQGLVPTLARWSALPVVGLAAFTAEVVDAASIVVSPAQARRVRLSDDFLAPPGWDGQGLSLQEPLVNGFDEPLAGDGVTVDLAAESESDQTLIRLRATGLPSDRVGVYRGRLGPSPDETIAVWLVIP
jgi:hypothetical protein